jgi:hypothetical protein
LGKVFGEVVASLRHAERPEKAAAISVLPGMHDRGFALPGDRFDGLPPKLTALHKD